MNSFDEVVAAHEPGGLASVDITTVQVNVGFWCNQSCAHCHVEASPDRREVMDWPTMEQVLRMVELVGCQWVDITGGAPELNPHLCRFIATLTGMGVPVQVRTNLTALLEAQAVKLPEFFREHKVALVGSLPCYLEENVDAQRGLGVYRKAIEVIGRLNGLGYGRVPELVLNLVYNPAGASLPPDQASLEADYRRELARRFGIVFTKLLTITNMPIGRFLTRLRTEGRDDEYRRVLADAFNPATLDGLMCRHQLSVGWDGTLYDCDFNLALNLPTNDGGPDHIARFDRELLCRRRVVTGDHCFGCTAGRGSSCAGELA
jgi:radical SAM/Cys-rich protein